MSNPRTDRKHATNPATLPPGTLVDLLLNAVDRFDRSDALLVRGRNTWNPISHRQLLDDVRALTKALELEGVQRGDRVGLLSENRSEWAVVDYALLCRGALTVPLYPTLPPGQLAQILMDAGALWVFVSSAEQLEKIQAAAATLKGGLARIVVFDEAPPASGVVSLRELLERGRARQDPEPEFRRRAREARPEDMATLIYTSGTTGQPKGVILTHNNLYSNVLAALRDIPIGVEDVALSFLPLSHVLERLVDYALFSRGCTLAYVASVNEVAQALLEVHPTVAVSVPRVYEKLYARILAAHGPRRRLILWARQVALEWADAVLGDKPTSAPDRLRHALADRLVFRKVRDRLGGRLRFFISGGAPLAPQIGRFFYGAGVLILEGYGLTETSPVTNVNTPDALRLGTVGKPIAGTEIMIAADGEILVRGPQVMKGYWHRPEATREVIDEAGWFHTGDIGDLDADGYLRITDRKKDLLVTAGGKNVAPQPIQNAAKQSRFVAEALLIGDRRPYPILLVVPNFASLEDWARHRGLVWPSREDLVSQPAVRAKLEREVLRRLREFARFEMPKKVLPVEREFSIERGEITPTLKIRRSVVEEHFRDRIEALYAEPYPAPTAVPTA